jgi:elongation factor 1 alpha-like protein
MRVPEHRKAEILIEPLYPRGGLLGGASSGGRTSKLAALAAKRKIERSETAKNNADSQDDYTKSLNKLKISEANKTVPSFGRTTTATRSTTEEPVVLKTNPPDRNPQPKETGPVVTESTAPDASLLADSNLRGRPSAFASIMTNHDTETHLSASPDLISVLEVAKSFDFTEPSPDDVVAKAQNPKGWK